jgi:putative tryptophan/tyrosine transport system substrate-binding protein
MRRRAFFALVGGAAAAATWPRPGRGQSAKTARVGWVDPGLRGDIYLNGLRQGLVDRGYVLGRDLEIEERYAEGNPEKLPTLIADLLALGVDVLAPAGTPAALAARKATSTVPIVSVTGDPVAVGLVASLSRPGGNVTGLSLLAGDYNAKWLELLKAAVPKLRRVAILWNPDNPFTQLEMRRLEEAAPPLGLTLTRLSDRLPELESSFAAIAAGSFDGMIVAEDASLDALMPRFVAFAAQARLPALYGESGFVRQGGLMSYSANLFEIWRRAAGYVDRILKGARPGDLPIEQATQIALKINLKTAKALGLDIPPLLLASADEVIE